MFRTVSDQVWCFDCEWVPDPDAGRVLYDLSDKTSPEKVMKEMWKQGGATDEDPQPYLKTVQCRVVSISAVTRRAKGNDVVLSLVSLPKDVKDPEQCKESAIIERFLSSIGEKRPQLVGFNSADADLTILVQRGVVNGLSLKEFCRRPEKPWEGPDYFSKTNEAHLDLKQYLCGWGKSNHSLNEIARLSGIPGKMDVSGAQVPELWLNGKLNEIVDYNEYDALTTYLLWLRLAHFAGHFDSKNYAVEQDRVRKLIADEAPSKPHLKRYREEWDRLRAKLEQRT